REELLPLGAKLVEHARAFGLRLPGAIVEDLFDLRFAAFWRSHRCSPCGDTPGWGCARPGTFLDADAPPRVSLHMVHAAHPEPPAREVPSRVCCVPMTRANHMPAPNA